MTGTASLDESKCGDALGEFLRSRRLKLDPTALGFSSKNRRTPGLRREEVAQRANISAAWYMCLEQGRGGAPSGEVLRNIANALLLDEYEHEYLHFLAYGHSPKPVYRRVLEVEARIQHLLDVLSPAPAFIKNATWDIAAQNEAVSLFWPFYQSAPASEKNWFRFLFLDERARVVHEDWESTARAGLSIFRADIAKVGAVKEANGLIQELHESSSDFRRLWQQKDIHTCTGGLVTLRHAKLGSIPFEISKLLVDGQQDLTMVTFLPVDPHDTTRLQALL